MMITVFGATGGVGQEILGQALAAGQAAGKQGVGIAY